MTNTNSTIKMTSRERSQIALKEDINHIIDKLWKIEEDELLYKIFTREHLKTRDIQKGAAIL